MTYQFKIQLLEQKSETIKRKIMNAAFFSFAYFWSLGTTKRIARSNLLNSFHNSSNYSILIQIVEKKMQTHARRKKRPGGHL